MKKTCLALILVLCFILSGCSGTAPESSSTAKTETSLTENTSATEDIAPADYYIEGIEPKEIPSGFSMEVPHVDFGSMEEFKQALETQTFTPEQISSIQYFPSDAKGIRSVHPDKVYGLTSSEEDGVYLKFRNVAWGGEEYSVTYIYASYVGFDVLTKDSYEKCFKNYCDWNRITERDDLFSNVEVSDTTEGDVLEKCVTYTTKYKKAKSFYYTIEEEHRTVHIHEEYMYALAATSFPPDLPPSNVHICLEYENGIYAYIWFDRLLEDPTDEWLLQFDIVPIETQTDAIAE